jgi:hypothetical protein
MSQEANELMSQLFGSLASAALHCTPFVLCWGEGTSFSSKHALRRVLCLAKEDRYIPGWCRKMVVDDVVVAAGSTQQAQLATQRAPQCATQHPTQRATQQEEACSLRQLSIVRAINHGVSCWCVWRSVLIICQCIPSRR